MTNGRRESLLNEFLEHNSATVLRAEGRRAEVGFLGRGQSAPSPLTSGSWGAL